MAAIPDPVPPSTPSVVALKTFTQAELDDAREVSYDHGYHDGFISGCDTNYEIRAAVRDIAGKLRAGIYTELRAIQEMEGLVQ